MKIWLVRHGQTRLNKYKIMQGRVNEPLNERGIEQAKEARERIGDIRFDAVYASPLDRAIVTGSIVSGWDPQDIIKDERLTEVDFKRFEGAKYYALGPRMTLYWALPEIFPAPYGVESLQSIAKRSASFLKELEQHEYDNVLVAAHGGIMRGLNGYLLDRKNGVQWRPHMHNCEVRVYESVGGKHSFIRSYVGK